jgi:hypothetical protein
MIVRILKSITLAILIWFALPWFIMDIPRTIRIHWAIGKKIDAVLGAVFACLEAALFLTAITDFWRFGEGRSGGRRMYRLQHGKLTLYSGLSILLLGLSEMYLFSRVPLSTMVSWVCFTDSWLGAITFLVFVLVCVRLWWNKDKKSIYGLQHGRLHLDTRVPMWMNMGYWKVSDTSLGCIPRH